MKKRAPVLSVATLLSATLLGGCGGMPIGGASGHINIISDPPGATAYADNMELGATPLAIVPGEHFRSGFVGTAYRYYGKLSLKKPGCEPYSIDVNDYILSRDVHATLKCDPDYHPPAPANAQQAAPSSQNYSERLERIEALRKQGLLSDEEYKNLRKRILDEL